MQGQIANLMGMFGGAGMGGGGMPGMSSMPGGASLNPAEIIKLQHEAQRQYQMANALRQIGGANSNNWGDVIATLIAGYKANKMQGRADENIAQAIEKGLAYEQQQKQAEAEKARREQEAKWAREDSVWQRRFDAEQAARMAAEQRAAERAAAEQAGQDNRAPIVRNLEAIEGLTPEQYALAQRAGLLPREEQEKERNAPSGYRWAQGDGESVLEAIPGGPADKPDGGKRPMPADAVRRLGLLDAAQEQLDQYINLSFGEQKGDKPPDYNEFKNRFGTGREAYLRQAIQNMLYAKSGAAATDKEIERMLDNYSPSMLQRDGTNWAQIQSLKMDLDTQRRAIMENQGSGVADGPTTPQGRSPEEVIATLRAANPGTSDEELIAYAREQGYF